MKFLVDIQLPGALVDWLRRKGADAVHALELEKGQADDLSIWNLAQKDQRIVISKDADFFILASRPTDQGKLIWVRMGNCRTRVLLTFFEDHWEKIIQALQDGQHIVELR